MTNKKENATLLLLSVFSNIRIHYVFLLVLSQYMVSIFLLTPKQPLLVTLLDIHLLILIVCTGLSIASGSLINNFYDLEKDALNRPLRSNIENLINQKTKLFICLILNTLTIILASIVSPKAALLFFFYIFLIWTYSHKFKKQLIVGIFYITLLSILPFIIIFLYFKFITTTLLLITFFFFTLIFQKNLIKVITHKLFLSTFSKSILVHKNIKCFFIFFSIFIALLSICLYTIDNIGYLNYYFLYECIFICLFLFLFLKFKHILNPNTLQNTLRFNIVTSIFSIILIDPNKLFFNL